jgi:hypothetical protein
MRKTIYILCGVISVGIGIFLLLTFILKVNNSGVGKYIPLNDRMILNTTNGEIFIPIDNGYGDLKWKKKISFKTEKEIDESKNMLKELEQFDKEIEEENKK